MGRHFLEQWQHEREHLKSKIVNALEGIKGRGDDHFDQKAKELHLEVFEEIDCLECANCCKTTPAILKGSDIKRISKHLKIPPKIFRRKYVLEDINGELSFQKIPCVFLKADNRCEIYEVRPESCRDYPHTGSGSFLRRIELHKANLDICPAVFEIVKRIQ